MIPGATISLLGTDRRATTDRRGRFAFTGVEPGTHRLAFAAPWLDSLGLPPIVRTVSLAGEGEAPAVILATPSVTTLARERCGGVLEEGYALLLGEVRGLDALPATATVVSAEWWERRIGRDLNDLIRVALVDTVGQGGRYVLCGVPRDAEVRVRAEHADGRRTAELLVRAPSPANARDLVIADPSARVTVTGQALRAGDAPLADAEVSLVGDSVVTVRTGRDGRFTLAGPFASGQLLVRAIGYTPAVVELAPVGERLDLAPVRLARAPQELPTVTTTGAPYTRARLEFEHRRRHDVGTFIDDEEIARIPVLTPGYLRGRVNRSRTDGMGSFWLVGSHYEAVCAPRIFVDGQFVGRTGSHRSVEAAPLRLQDYLQEAKRVEIYRAAFAPPRYSDSGGCGSIVISTQ